MVTPIHHEGSVPEPKKQPTAKSGEPETPPTPQGDIFVAMDIRDERPVWKIKAGDRERLAQMLGIRVREDAGSTTSDQEIPLNRTTLTQHFVGSPNQLVKIIREKLPNPDDRASNNLVLNIEGTNFHFVRRGSPAITDQEVAITLRNLEFYFEGDSRENRALITARFADAVEQEGRFVVPFGVSDIAIPFFHRRQGTAEVVACTKRDFLRIGRILGLTAKEQ